MKVAFFPGCLVDMLYPEIGVAAVQVLERLGCEVEMPKETVCCGQMFINSGYAEDSAKLARMAIDAYDAAGWDTIVSLTGSCMEAIVTDYPEMLKDDPVYSAKIARLAPRFHEFTDFIVNTLGLTDVGANLEGTVTYHQSCHLGRMLGIVDEPLKLLSGVEGLSYVEMEHRDRCCGFGGTFSIKEPEISEAIVREKAQTVIATGADILCGADVPCLMNIKGCLERMREAGELDREIRVMHIAQILNSGFERKE